MWCDPPSIPSADVTQPSQSNWPSVNENKQLSFVYQPGVGLYDKNKIDLDQDLRITPTTADIDERIQPCELSPSSSVFTSDVDHRWSSPSSIESSSPTTKTVNLYKTCLRRQNEQDSLPIRQKLFSSDDILSDKNKKSFSSNDTHYHVQLFNINNSNVNISTSQENNPKRKFDQNLLSNKKLRHSFSSLTTFQKCHSWSNEQNQSQSLSKSTSSNSIKLSNENLKCGKKNLLDEELDRQKAKLVSIEEQRRKQQSSPIKLRLNSNERLQKQSITPITKSIPMVKKSSENQKLEVVQLIPTQGLLLCPKIEPIKKKKKKKIAATITESTKSLDDDPILDSILFDEMQSIQQQWQQFMTLTMEKEFHTNPSDGKKKIKRKKFHRTDDFMLAYENLYDFEGMRHWYPTSR